MDLFIINYTSLYQAIGVLIGLSFSVVASIILFCKADEQTIEHYRQRILDTPVNETRYRVYMILLGICLSFTAYLLLNVLVLVFQLGLISP